MPVEIERHGWELHVKRLGLHRAGERVRTYGAYQVLIDGEPVTSLSGHVCECTGPGDNTAHGKKQHLRIREGRYALSTQFGERYRSVDFTDDARHPLPGFRLLGTKVRTAVLVHPGHPPDLYLSSIGCFNPTGPLTADQDMSFAESRARVIAMLDSLRQRDPAAFAKDKIGHNTAIAGAFIVVDGEPMGEVSDGAIV
jgi:aerobic-type carbon monoxide dehydrogenase small subunit (CoxS/CutS family)